MSVVDECLRMSELLPRLAFKGDLVGLKSLLAWVERRAATVAEGGRGWTPGAAMANKRKQNRVAFFSPQGTWDVLGGFAPVVN